MWRSLLESLWRDPEETLTIALQTIIPVVTLSVSIWGAFTFWATTFGSPALALGVMLALESIALIGFVLHVADLAPRHPFRALRHTLPLLPAAPLVHPVHDVLIASPIIADFATAVRWTLDTTAWVAAGLLTATAVGIAWVAWETFGDTLRNRQAWVLARIDRERTREMQRIRVDQARARAELDVREAQVAAVREATRRQLEAERRELENMIPVMQASLAAAVQRQKAVRHALQELNSDVESGLPAPAPPPPAPPPVGKGSAPAQAPLEVRLAYAAFLITQGHGMRAAARGAGLAPSTLGDRLRASNRDAARLYQQVRAALPADAAALLDELITARAGR
ncbi:MAG: hypothetical protein J7466_15085 [Roseiflexus sp.]|nr:hypothetical protein [Roseiflexus sp.]